MTEQITDKQVSDQQSPRKLSPAELVASDPARYRYYPDSGTVYDMVDKRIAGKDNSVNPQAITKDNSMDMHVRRATLVMEGQEYARNGIARHLGRETYLEAHADIAGNMAALGEEWKSDPKQARASVEATRLALQMAGMLDTGRSQPQLQPGNQEIATLALEAVNRVLSLAQNAPDQTVDGEYHEVE